jgi:hypothetical protein
LLKENGDDDVTVKIDITNRVREMLGTPKPQNHYIMAANAVRYEDWQRVGEFMRERMGTRDIGPIDFFCEGLIMYIEKEQDRPQSLENGRLFLENYSPNGRIISPDFTMTPELLDRYPSVRGTVDDVEKAVQGKVEPYASTEVAIAAARQAGLKAEIRTVDDVVARLKTPGMFGLDMDAVKWVSDHYRPMILTLNSR